jgi:hypothetical protein
MRGMALVLGVFVFISFVCAQEYFPLSDHQLYCYRYDISRWCTAVGFADLTSMVETEIYPETFTNELLFDKSKVYTGPVSIVDIKVEADVEGRSEVTARYKLRNTGSEDQPVKLALLRAPESTKVYENDVDIDLGALKRWDSILAAGEEKEYRVEFSEALYGDIFGYNVNLLIDDLIPSDQITPSGRFEFTLPGDAKLKDCAPEGYATSTENGRTKVTWEKTDFSPWTNPFNDLICTWEVIEETAVPEPVKPKEEKGGYNPAVMVIAIIVVILIVFMLYRFEQGKPKKKK